MVDTTVIGWCYICGYGIIADEPYGTCDDHGAWADEADSVLLAHAKCGWTR